MIEKLKAMKYRNVKSPQLCILQTMICCWGKAGGKDYKCLISYKVLFLKCSLHSHVKREFTCKEGDFLKVSVRHLIE